MIFLVGMKGNNDCSGIVDIRGALSGHDIDYPISLFLSAKSGSEYIGNAGQCQKHLPGEYGANIFHSKPNGNGVVFKSA